MRRVGSCCRRSFGIRLRQRDPWIRGPFMAFGEAGPFNCLLVWTRYTDPVSPGQIIAMARMMPTATLPAITPTSRPFYSHLARRTFSHTCRRIGRTTKATISRFGNMNGNSPHLSHPHRVANMEYRTKHGTCISTLNPDCYADHTPTEEVVDFFQKTVDLFKTLPSYQVRHHH